MEQKKKELTVGVLEFKGTNMGDLEIIDHGEQPLNHIIGQIKVPKESLARLAIYNEDMVGAIFEIDQNLIDWEKDHVSEVIAKGKRICNFDSVLTSNDTREI